MLASAQVSVRKSRLGFIALAVSTLGFFLFPFFTGIVGFILGLMAWRNGSNKITSGVAMAFGALNVLVPVFVVFLGIAIQFTFCALLGGR